MDERIDEALEIIWTLREEGSDPKVGEGEVLDELIRRNLVKIRQGKIILTETGETHARRIVRRHRLAERLLSDVLEIRQAEIEESACKFEHILSEDVEEGICTLLGHPKECPHGKPIPPGKCCLTTAQTAQRLILPLTELRAGEKGRIVYMHLRRRRHRTRRRYRLQKLASLGLVPGTPIKLLQKIPAYIIQVEETLISLEEEVAGDIYVRRKFTR
jgi:DtxR family Mn-dependent transcriptional regulator